MFEHILNLKPALPGVKKNVKGSQTFTHDLSLICKVKDFKTFKYNYNYENQ